MMEEPSKTIRQVVKEIGEHPYDINNGKCGILARIVAERLEEAEPRTTGQMYDQEPPYPSEYYGHTWIYYKGKHYDAEELEGVENWKNLPIFNRRTQ